MKYNMLSRTSQLVHKEITEREYSCLYHKVQTSSPRPIYSGDCPFLIVNINCRIEIYI